MSQIGLIKNKNTVIAFIYVQRELPGWVFVKSWLDMMGDMIRMKVRESSHVFCVSVFLRISFDLM